MNHQPETDLLYECSQYGCGTEPSVPPLYQNTFFSFPSFEAAQATFASPDGYTYSRIKNPTVTQAEEKIAALSEGEEAILCASGMGAISGAVLHCVRSGDHIVAVRNINMPIKMLFTYLSEKFDISVTYIGGRDAAEFEQAITDQTSLFYLESPTSEDYRVIDLAAVVEIAKRHSIKTILDNTWSTPLYQKPLTMGIDLEVASCSKYLGGHSDIVSGVIIGKSADIQSIRAGEYSVFGAKMSPSEAWLLLRSLRTLPLRMAKHQENGLAVAQFLANHPKVKTVYHPGLSSDPDHERSTKQMSGYTGRFTAVLDTDDPVALKRFINHLKLFHLGVSWGGHESQIHSPGVMSFGNRSREELKKAGIEVGSLRFSIGLENADDLIADLAAALEIL